MAHNNRHRQMPADAIEMLHAEHQEIRDRFRRYAAATDPYTKGLIAEHAMTELELHAQLEEQLFYPAFAWVTAEPARIANSREDHQHVRRLIDALRDVAPDAPTFHALFQTLIDRVERHIAAEETELFPAAAEVLADQMATLTTAMQGLKRQLRNLLSL